MALKRHDLSIVASSIEQREPQALEAFLADCGIEASARARAIGDAVRKSLAHAASFDGDKLRADDRYPGTLEVLPGWDSLDFVEWLLTFEERLGDRVPHHTFHKIHGSFTVADLVKHAVQSSILQLPKSH